MNEGANGELMARPMRRILTGHNAQGKSVILSDGPSPHVLELAGMPGLALINLWVTDGAPARGTIFRVVDFPPDAAMAAAMDRGKAFEAMGAGHAMDPGAARHPGMHKTSTVDYALVLDGEIWAIMDEGEVLMRAGDCLVQRGTNHAWSNRSDRPCRIAFILVNADPV